MGTISFAQSPAGCPGNIAEAEQQPKTLACCPWFGRSQECCRVLRNGSATLMSSVQMLLQEPKSTVG